MPIYRCSDGLCGADDCSRCRPGNENEQEYNAARDEYLEHKGDEMRERECDE